LQQRLTELQTQLETTQNEIQTQKGRLDTAIAEFQQQFSKQQDARQEQFTAAEKERTEGFSKALDERDKKFDEVSDAHKERFDKICDAASDKLAKLHEETTVQIKSYIGTLDEYKEKAEKLVHVIGNTGMVGGYQKTANTERTTARVWQVLAVLSLGGFIWFAVSLSSAALAAQISWGNFGARAVVAFAFGIAAAFCARQSDRHEDSEAYNRRIELELASIDPYLVGLPDDTQHAVKVELAKRLFGQKPTPKKQQKVSGTNADLLRMTIETITELAKK
jgi:hypothetical protein